MTTLKLELAAPIVEGAVNGYLDPVDIPAGGVTVRVGAYTGRAAGQSVRVHFGGQNGSREITAARDVADATTPMDFKISKEEVVRNQLKSAVFSYQVARVRDALFSPSEPVPVVVSSEADSTYQVLVDFEGLPIGTLTDTISFPRLSLEIPTGSRCQIQSQTQSPPFVIGKYLEMVGGAHNRLFLNFTQNTSYLKIGYKADHAFEVGIVYRNAPTVTYSTVPAGASWAEFRSPGASGGIESLLIDNRLQRESAIIIDNIEFTWRLI